MTGSLIYHPVITELQSETIRENGITCSVLRLDLIDKHAGGNKFFKLKYNLIAAQQEQLPVMTFGGAYSNHILATACSCYQNNIRCVGIIRGDEKRESNYILTEAQQLGMRLHFVSREEYRMRNDHEYQNSLTEIFGKHFIIPEGGANEEGVMGCKEILPALHHDFDFILLPAATGSTLAGIALTANRKTNVIGIAVLKGEEYLEALVNSWTEGKHTAKWMLNHQYHFGGYAKSNDELKKFIPEFNRLHRIPLEPVYSAKLFYALNDLIDKKYFPFGSRILAIHTGGVHDHLPKSI